MTFDISNGIKIGCDPELFVIDEETGKNVSAHDLIPGTKQDPYMVKFGAVQVDGVAAEFNISPAMSEDEFVLFINTVRDRLEVMVKENNPNYSLVAKPTATFDQGYFDGLPFEAKLLGCEPDWSAYTGQRNTPPSTDEPFRTGSGHIHVGFGKGFDMFSEEHITLCCNIVKQIDAVIYAASHTWDGDFKRRTLYGAKGAFRPKSYGLEYRSLSNAWLNSEDTTRLVYRLVKRAVELYFEGVILYEA